VPGPAAHRYRRGPRRGSDLVGILLVVVVGLGFGRWFVDSASVDLNGVTVVPVALGFTTWGDQPVRAHSGADAPPFAPTPSPVEDVPTAAPVASPGADPGACSANAPSFVLGLAELKNRVGEAMGDPIECERAVDADGDTEQLTTTGLAAYAEQTHTVSFTDGWRRWGLSAGSLGLSVDDTH
jgi:hypothetical protein